MPRTKSSQIRKLFAAGRTPAEIARKLDVTRQAVHNALKRQDPGVAIDQGKSGGRITIRFTEEQLAALEKAKRRNETLSACVVRLLERGLRVRTHPRGMRVL